MMTRFARAKGSKASNERVPNEATPWCELKQQWADNSAMKNERPEKTKSAKELLRENDDPFYYDTTGNVNTDWAEFEPVGASKKAKKGKAQSSGNETLEKGTKKLDNTPAENGSSIMRNSNGGSLSPKKSKKQKFTVQPVESATECITKNETNVKVAQSAKQKSAKKAKKHTVSLDSVVAENTTNSESVHEISGEPKKKKKKLDSSASPVVENTTDLDSTNAANHESIKKKKKKNKEIDSMNLSTDSVMENTANGESTNDTNSKTAKKKKRKDKKKMEKSTSETCTATNQSLEVKEGNTENKGSLVVSKRHKRNQKRLAKKALITAGVDKNPGETASSGGFNATGNDWDSNLNFGKQQKFGTKENGNESRPANGNANGFNRPQINQNGTGNNPKKRKAPKIRDDKEHKRRKPGPTSTKCIINGMELEIVMFEGFPVKKEDAERLKDLRQQMVMKGIPKSEIDGAMKLERRRAEKSLARVRKQVCFHCRKAGHNLSDCPEVGEEESATGICFKCGSTEHTHFECKVTKKEEFRFASCFICREQGHIAKQCPDNPKGLYPQGGACKICGDVTHLRKDCPDLARENEESTVTLSTIAGNTLESLDDDVTRKVAVDDSKKSKSKIVKF